MNHPVFDPEALRKAWSKFLPPQWAENAKKARVAAHLLDRIYDREWEVGDQLPSIEDLAEAYSVSDGTIIAARNALVEQGILRVDHGIGTFVEEIPEEDAEEDDPIEAMREARDAIDRAIAALERERQ